MSFSLYIRSKIQHFDRKKYWKYVQNIKKKPSLFKYLYLYKIKKMDAFNNASLGIEITGGAQYLDMPFFPHGIWGIVISPKSIIGRGCVFFHQVTIGNTLSPLVSGRVAPILNNNVIVFPGAKILGPINVGENSIILANSVVVNDVPPFSIVGGVPGKVIKSISKAEFDQIKTSI